MVSVAKRLMWQGSLTIYFHWCSFMRGHRSTTPKWCVGVCSGPTRIWVIGLAHPHQHDTAQKNRLARLPAETGCTDPAAHPAHSHQYILHLCGRMEVHVRRKGKIKMSQPLVPCAIVSALQHLGIICRSLCFCCFFMFCVFTPPKAVCKMKGLVVPQGREWWFSDYIVLYLEETPRL